MDAQETRVFRRPKFDPEGVIVARREATIDGKTYPPNDQIPPDVVATLQLRDRRTLGRLYDQLAIDTYPPGARRVTMQPGGEQVWLTPGEVAPPGAKARR